VKLIVAGGAGYIGSHFVRTALRAGHEIIIIDDLSTGHKEAVDDNAVFYETDIRDKDKLDGIFAKEKNIDAVVHFAARSIVSESMKKPLEYYDNNVTGAISLLESMVGSGIGRIVFSSTAAVYGEPAGIPVTEDSSTQPTNVYGETKLTMEKIMRRLADNGDIRYAALRYFNACGADASGEIGEDHDPETHLIPILLDAAAGRRDGIQVFGTDYPTEDGTCIRDYIHVCDLAEAHLKALEYLDNGGESTACNLGNGRGFSVMEVIRSVERVTGQQLKVGTADRRPGDPARLVASAEKAGKLLKWAPEYTGIDEMVASAWKWHQNRF